MEEVTPPPPQRSLLQERWKYDEGTIRVDGDETLIATVASVEDFPCLDAEETEVSAIEADYHAVGDRIVAEHNAWVAGPQAYRAFVGAQMIGERGIVMWARPGEPVSILGKLGGTAKEMVDMVASFHAPMAALYKMLADALGMSLEDVQKMMAELARMNPGVVLDLHTLSHRVKAPPASPGELNNRAGGL